MSRGGHAGDQSLPQFLYRSVCGVQVLPLQLTAMALGCVLWVLWICFLHLPAIKGYRYASKSDSLNMGGDADDEVMHSLSLDDWRDSNGQQAGPANTNYKPSAAQKAGYVPTRQAVPSAPEVERLVNGDFRDWGLENVNEPLVFPLRRISKPSDPATPQTGPILSQPSLNVDSSNGMNASPNTGGAFQSGSPNAEPVPFYTYQGEKTPSYNSWQPEPVNVGYGVAGSPTQYSNTGSSTHEGDPRQEPHLVFEDVFQYPTTTEQSPRYDNTAGGSGQASYGSNGSPTEYSSEPSFPSYPANAGGQHVLPPRKGSSFFSQSDQPHDEKTPVWRPQKTVIQTQRVSEPIRSRPPPPPPPSTYIVQSRNGYKRARYLLNKSSYSKELSPPIPVGSMDVKGPAKGQPAAPKGVKNPQRTKG